MYAVLSDILWNGILKVYKVCTISFYPWYFVEEKLVSELIQPKVSTP